MATDEQLLMATRQKIDSCEAKIGIIGLGYVGLPLALAFADKMKVYGYDSDSRRRALLADGRSPVDDVTDQDLSSALADGLVISQDPSDIGKCDVIIVCVPTPLNDRGNPDLSYIEQAAAVIESVVRAGMLIILESTSYPGTTEEYLGRAIRRATLAPGRDVGLVFSPERVDPGNKRYSIRNTPKVVGGLGEQSISLAVALYSKVVDAGIVEVKDCATAEAVKIVENIFRGVNIALINELALIFEKMDINTWEVVNAASTKPFSFMPHYPGPGVGGHCIPLDPLFMSYKAKQYGFIPRFIELSREINEFMKIHTVNLTMSALREADLDPEKATVAILGLAYKKNISDTRESPSIQIISELSRRVNRLLVHDTKGTGIRINDVEYTTSTLDDVLSEADCLVFVTDHDEYSHMQEDIIRSKKVRAVVDSRNIFSATDFVGHSKVYKSLGK